jgi:hypothetical protein
MLRSAAILRAFESLGYRLAASDMRVQNRAEQAYEVCATRGRENDSNDEAFKSTQCRTLPLNAHAMIIADVLEEVTSN